MRDMMRELLFEQKKALDLFLKELSFEAMEELLSLLEECEGTLFWSGVGKSGHIARKISGTLSAMGVASAFLPPTDALHGDLGLVRGGDRVVGLSKSGASQELCELFSAVKRKGGFTIALVSRRGSLLEKEADATFYLPFDKELCVYGLSPTTSCWLQLLVGDCLAVALTQKKGGGASEFALNHPAGLLGKQLNLRVEELMWEGGDLPLVRPQEKLVDCLWELSSKCAGSLLIAEKKKLVGIFTDGDLRRSLEKWGGKALNMPLSLLMTEQPKTIAAKALVTEALSLMAQEPSRPITVLPVLEKGEIVGLIRLHDIIQTGLLPRGIERFQNQIKRDETEKEKGVKGCLNFPLSTG